MQIACYLQKVSEISDACQPGGIVADVETASTCEPVGKPLSRVMTLLGKRWAGMILSALMQGSLRFNEIKRAVPGVSDRILIERLGEFQELQLVARTVTETSPVRVEYALTDRGEAMRPAITELTRWAEQNLSPDL
ncbi:winged helix-turn-helix transcriptional regulator [Curtobacterium sp. VKM Ac-2887]|uniref:winged helix-turn-helix transcriptional regulator n=1 Tax=Curtobacterium sp. VKM Ac-2887 TaxID=2783819 RepID=UPI00188AFBC1|nr:helix-turn-helix domain-containing protein [Curtobacterium sp. VKM Ac-2887]MBF4588294.1 helix-turn-helix transcriptional regulator [Curtobacterium sp. VKM Ac-2887]